LEIDLAAPSESRIGNSGIPRINRIVRISHAAWQSVAFIRHALHIRFPFFPAKKQAEAELAVFSCELSRVRCAFR